MQARPMPHNRLRQALVATDPPYYDNVGYADLSDFFYVWLRRSLPDHLSRPIRARCSPPRQMNWSPILFGMARSRMLKSSSRQASTQVFHRATMTMHYRDSQSRILCVSSRPRRLRTACIDWMGDPPRRHARSGWTVTATWPIRTELRAVSRDIDDQRSGLVNRPRLPPPPSDAGFTDRRGLITALREEFPSACGSSSRARSRRSTSAKPRSALAWPSSPGTPGSTSQTGRRCGCGPRSPSSTRCSTRSFQLEGNVSADTRFCVEWFKQYGFDAGRTGRRRRCQGDDTSIAGLERAGVVESRAGKVKLLVRSGYS